MREGTALALQDLSRGIHERHAWLLLAWEDVHSRYRRTVLGPLWITLSHGLYILALALSFSVLFGQQLDHYLVYLAAGMTIWSLISSSLTDAPVIFQRAHGMLFAYDLPASIHIFRAVLSQVIIFAHHMLIYLVAVLVVTVFFHPVLNVNSLLFIPAMAILISAMVGWSMILALLGTRYRDLAPAVAAVTQMLFMLTPVFWDRANLQHHQWFALINPFYHLIDIVRLPLLGKTPDLLNWAVSAGVAAALLGVGTGLYAWKRRQLSYWF